MSKWDIFIENSCPNQIVLSTTKCSFVLKKNDKADSKSVLVFAFAVILFCQIGSLDACNKLVIARRIVGNFFLINVEERV